MSSVRFRKRLRGGLPAPAATAFTAPAAITADTTPQFAWNAADDATKYELQVATDSGFTSLVIDLTGVNAITDTDYTPVSALTAWVTLYARVRGFNVSVPGAWSDTLTFAVTPAFMRDEYTTDAAAGSVNLTAAEAYGGLRMVNDPDDIMSITGGQLVVTGLQAVIGNGYRPAISYAAIPRNSTPKILVSTITPTTNRGPDEAGFYSRKLFPNWAYAVRCVSQGFYACINGTVSAKLANYVNGTTYQIAVILLENGGEIWVKGGAFVNWTQIHIDTTAATSSSVYPTFAFFAYSSAIAASVNVAQVSVYTGGSLDDYFNALAASLYRPTYNVLLLGDSKTMESNAWKLPGYCGTHLEGYIEAPARIATSGWTTANAAAGIDAALGARAVIPHFAMINLGANDVPSMPAEATWKANTLYYLDAINTYAPDCICVLERVWRRNYAAECNTLATWMADVVAARPTFVQLGPDERVYLENGDDGVTYTSDGIHPTVAGYELKAQQWSTVLAAITV